MKKRRGAMITVGILIVILMALEVFLCVWFFGDSYPEFDGMLRYERAIEGLKEDFVPQGLSSTEEGDLLVSGYMAKEGASRLYLLGETGKYVTVKSGEKTLTSHFGGVACKGDDIYLTNGSIVERISLADVKAAENGGAVTVKESVQTPLDNAFCFVSGDKLYAGEFYREANYPTDGSHHLEVKGGMNYAFTYVYQLGEGGTFSAEPLYGYSICALVQGFAVKDGKIYLSCSYGLDDSKLYLHKDPAGSENFRTVDGVKIYVLDNDTLERTLTMPSMSEGLCMKEDRLFVLFESDCSKYRYFVRRTIDEVVSLPLSLTK